MNKPDFFLICLPFFIRGEPNTGINSKILPKFIHKIASTALEITLLYLQLVLKVK